MHFFLRCGVDCFIAGPQVVEGAGLVPWVGGHPDACWILPKRSIPKPDQHRRDIVQQESFRH